jgi:hypothetical protein
MKLTKKDFKYFKKRLKFWQEKLGCDEVRILPEFKILESENHYAEYDRYEDCGTLLVKLNSRPKKTGGHNLDRIAFHEVFEGIYLYPLRSMAHSTYSDWEVERATHAAVRRAETTIFEAMKKG